MYLSSLPAIGDIFERDFHGWPQKFHADYVNLECNIFILSTNQIPWLESD